MHISGEGEVGIFLALLALAGAGAIMIYPTHLWIGWLLILVSVGGAIGLAINHFGLWQMKPVPSIGMGLSAALFIAFAIWNFWPQSTMGEAASRPVIPIPFPSSINTQTPELRALVDGANIFIPDARDMRNVSGIALDVKIWNTGRPSAVVDYRLVIYPKVGNRVIGQITKIPDHFNATGKYNSLSMGAADDLSMKTIAKVGNDIIIGKLLFYANIQKQLIEDANTEIELYFADDTGSATKIKKRIGDWMAR
jgi:hypothetical protein